METSQTMQHKQPTNNLQKKTEDFSRAITRFFSRIGKKFDSDIVTSWVTFFIEEGVNSDEFAYMIHNASRDLEIEPHKLTVAKLLSYIKPKLNALDEAHEEWTLVLRYVQKGGAYHGFADGWQNRTVLSIQSVGGLDKIGMTEEKDLSYVRHQFIEAFKSYSNIEGLHQRQLELGTLNNPQLNEAMENCIESTKF